MSLWSCASCSKSFTRKGDLTRHELLHTGIKPHVCETCGKGFAQYSGLKTHRNVQYEIVTEVLRDILMERVSTRSKPYMCGIGTCTKAFGDPSSRARHRKETHRREGAYKCIIADCGTRIKRRSAFVAHLRKHGLDPSSLDLDAIALQSSEGGIPAPTHFAFPDVENKSQYSAQSRSVSPSLLSDGSGYYALTDNGATSHFTDEWPGDYSLDGQLANISPANNTLLPMLDQTTNVSPDIPHDMFPYVPSNLEDFYFDGVFPTAIGYPHLTASPLNLPVFEPFMEAGVDGFQSTSSSPPSTYSVLYTTGFNDDVMSLSLTNNASQEPLLYNFM